MACAQCGASIPDGFKYCAHCSAALARQSVTGVGDDTHRLLAEANLLRIRKQLDDAIAICTRVLRLDPANSTAHSLMGDIHRDEGDFREALGWFKLAVQLNPDNPADRKKLEEMIDRVFPGGKQPVAEEDAHDAVVPETAEAPLRPKVALLPAVREILYKITPTQVIIGSTVLAVVVGLMIALPHLFTEQTKKRVVVTTPGTPPAAAQSPVDAANPSPDNPPERRMIIGPQPTDTTPPKLNNTTPSTAPALSTDPTTPPDTKDVTPTIPPFNPQVKPRMTAEQLDQMTEKIRTAMLEHLKTLKLQTALLGLTLNPATKVLTIEYEVPLLKGPTQTKEGLLYSGFELVWVADNNSSGNIVRFSLCGHGHLAPGQPAKLVLYADVSPQQANEARNASDYGTVAKEMSNVWWHDDIAKAEL